MYEYLTGNLPFTLPTTILFWLDIYLFLKIYFFFYSGDLPQEYTIMTILSFWILLSFVPSIAGEVGVLMLLLAIPLILILGVLKFSTK